MIENDARLLKLLTDPGRSVTSGVASVVDPELSVVLNEYGEFSYSGLDEGYAGPLHDVAGVSAFVAPLLREEAIAERRFGSGFGVHRHSLAGIYHSAFAGWVNDGAARARSSSGGIATWVLEKLLVSGEVDGVIHMTSSSEPGRMFSYTLSRTVEEVRAGAKTRYYPGELSRVLKELQKLEGRFALVAIPSIAYEVRLLQTLRPEFEHSIRYIVGLICGHQKSTHYADYLIRQFGYPREQVESIDFRAKVPGLPANHYSTEITVSGPQGRSAEVRAQESLLGTDWGHGYFKVGFSDLTQDVFNETADVVVGDAWLPQYVADGRGTNVVVVRNPELLHLLNLGAANGEIILEDLGIEEVLKSQASLVRHNVHEAEYRWKLAGLSPREREWLLGKGSMKRLPVERRLMQRLRLRIYGRSRDAYRRVVYSGDLRGFGKLMLPLVVAYRGLQRIERLRVRLRRASSKLLRALDSPVGRRSKK